MISDYTGIPYNFREYNCWHHVMHVREDQGIYTPEFDAISPADIDEAFTKGFADTKGLVQVYEPKNFDVVLLQFRHASSFKWHSGVYYDGMISHCERASKQVKIESIKDISKRYTRLEFWR